jgi:hypothetical protein
MPEDMYVRRVKTEGDVIHAQQFQAIVDHLAKILTTKQ